jgi:D-cysteine desulfhydrase family pyridoxal phosphate-dependent enzyme
VTSDALRAILERVPTVPLASAPTPVDPLPRLSTTLGRTPHLFIKRDDAIPFGFGGNKVRKLAFVTARAHREGADTLITAGGIQSNHARATACAAAALGMRAVLVANGRPPARSTANALLDALLGAEIEYVAARRDRGPAMEAIADRLRASGRKPFVIPIGASTPLGALGYVRAMLELLEQMPAPDVIVHATSSGGTQAGLVAAARLLNLRTTIIGVSADDPADALAGGVASIVSGIGDLLGLPAGATAHGTAIQVDDRFVGEGYGIPTAESREALELAARSDAIFLDPTYTAKAMAGLIAYVRERRFSDDQTVLFWHTGGQVGLFA